MRRSSTSTIIPTNTSTGGFGDISTKELFEEVRTPVAAYFVWLIGTATVGWTAAVYFNDDSCRVCMIEASLLLPHSP